MASLIALSVMRRALLFLLGSTTIGCPLLVSDPPTALETGSASSSTGSSDTWYECSESAYSCYCEVSPDGNQSSPGCYPTVPHTADVCCASLEWPSEGSCGCTVMSCDVGITPCECTESLTDGVESCGAGSSCTTVSGCYDAQFPGDCASEAEFMDLPCAVSSIPCPSGKRVAYCDDE